MKMLNKERIVILILVTLLSLSVCFASYLYFSQTPTAIITPTLQNELQEVDKENKLRIKMNTTITIQNHTMQNLNFENLNKGRNMQCKIRLIDEESYLYISPLLAQGKKIEADVIEDHKFENGSYDAIAEIYSYNQQNIQTNQTNVKITLVKQ